MTPRRGSCPFLLFSLVGLLVTCAQEPDTARQNTTAAAEKAGICPQAELETPNGNCTEECQSDASCEGNQKCCQTGCGTSCQIPDGIPKGFLPVPAADQLGLLNPPSPSFAQNAESQAGNRPEFVRCVKTHTCSPGSTEKRHRRDRREVIWGGRGALRRSGGGHAGGCALSTMPT